MTAADITTRYGTVQSVFNKPTAWFTLLHIAAAGEQGVTRNMLKALPGCAGGSMVGLSVLQKWEAAGLITSQLRKARHGHPRRWFHITPKALQLLRLDP